jgi:hypothetical protein
MPEGAAPGALRPAASAPAASAPTTSASNLPPEAAAGGTQRMGAPGDRRRRNAEAATTE